MITVHRPRLGHLLFWEDPRGFTDAAASFLLDSGGAGTDGRGFRDFRP